jgi:uncharacterized BrkB/YihY/UPF0761 family membrane protein
VRDLIGQQLSSIQSSSQGGAVIGVIFGALVALWSASRAG